MSNTIGYSLGGCVTGVRYNLTQGEDATGNMLSYQITQCARAIISVIVTPDPVTLVAGAEQQFSAEVVNAESQEVTWSCLFGTIDGDGLYTAPNYATSDTVTATSVEGGVTGTAAVTVMIPQIEGFNPIIEPTLPLETTATYEPNVIFENGKFTMWYSGGWNAPGVFRAESADGLTWTKSATPVIGQGYGGVSGVACRPTVIVVDGVYYCYYASKIANLSNWMRVSSTDGVTWSSPTVVAAYTLIPGRSGFANSTVWVEDGTWYGLVEAFGGGSPQWAIYLMSSADGVSWTVLNGELPLSTLQVAEGGMYGGANLFRSGAVEGTYHLFYHACPTGGTTPTNIYHASSTDKVNWTRTTAPVLLYDGDEMGYDQIADASVFESDGRLYLFYDQTDNEAESAYIGVAELEGGIEDFLSGSPFTRVLKWPERRDGSAPTEYWNMSESSGQRMGSVAGIDLDPAGSVSTTTNMSGGVAANLTADGKLYHASVQGIQVGNFDWTICGWFKVSDQARAPAIVQKYGVTERQYAIYAGEPNGLRFVVHFDDVTYTDVYGTPGTPVPNGVWVFFRAWHSAAGDVIGLQINNGTKYTTAWAKGANPTGMRDLTFGSWGGTNASSRGLSRSGYWKRLLTDAESTALYNGGNGVDYP